MGTPFSIASLVVATAAMAGCGALLDVQVYVDPDAATGPTGTPTDSSVVNPSDQETSSADASVGPAADAPATPRDSPSVDVSINVTADGDAAATTPTRDDATGADGPVLGKGADGGYCGDGVVNGPEACDGGGSGAVTLGACNPECTGFYTKKTVTATSAFSSGNLGGPSGADTICQTQFGAGWKALLVGGTRRATLTPFVGDGAQDWVLQKYTYYYNAQDQLIWRTDSVPLLGVSGGARQPLSASVYDAISGGYAWSGWQMDWTTVPDLPASAIGTCIGWTSASSSDWGQFAAADLTPFNDGCNTTYRILCVQQ